MWKEVNPEIVQKVIDRERREAQKKFWAFFLLWVVLCMLWIMGILPRAELYSLSLRTVQISYMILLALLAIIFLDVIADYNRRVATFKNAKYMMTVPCKQRDRLRAKGSSDLFQGHFVSFEKSGNKDSGWVPVSPEFYEKCTIGTEMLIVAADQADPMKMFALDPEEYDSDLL
ncbi:MAG: hypothetical protein GXY43_01625 [Clostridiaceae bacterium]|nr:hypothetical protein [Clostridiaceae bacterium]